MVLCGLGYDKRSTNVANRTFTAVTTETAYRIDGPGDQRLDFSDDFRAAFLGAVRLGKKRYNFGDIVCSGRHVLGKIVLGAGRYDTVGPGGFVIVGVGHCAWSSQKKEHQTRRSGDGDSSSCDPP